MTTIIEHAERLTKEKCNKLLATISKLSGHNNFDRAAVPSVTSTFYSFSSEDALQELLTKLMTPGDLRREAALRRGHVSEPFAMKWMVRNARWLQDHARTAWSQQVPKFHFLDAVYETDEGPMSSVELSAQQASLQEICESDETYAATIAALKDHHNERLIVVFEMVLRGEAKGATIAKSLAVTPGQISHDLEEIQAIMLHLQGFNAQL